MAASGWESSALEHGTFEVIYNLGFEPAIEDYEKDGAVLARLNEVRAERISASTSSPGSFMNLRGACCANRKPKAARPQSR